jgi:long-chain acyl-CoA synthetase
VSYLPLSHIFEKIVCYMMLSQGGAIGYYQGDVRKLFEDIEVLRPTVFPSVPRLFQRLYDKVTQQVASSGLFKRSLFNWAFDSKVDTLEAGGSQRSLWDGLVFKALRAKLGGRVRYIITGSAPISSELFRFLQVCFSCAVIQGYGLTETAAGATITVPGDTTIGHVGPPLACTEIKLQDVPEMEYFSTDEPQPRGEVCMRGPNIFHGYYKSPEKTKEAIDEDGWFHTGDVGTITGEGNLKIIDRKKNCCKLSIGEYIALEYLESIFLKNKYVAMMFVYADSLENCVIAVAVPDPDVLLPWARENNIPHADNLDAVCRETATVEHLLASIQQTGRAKGIKSFEHVRALHLEPELFSVESNLLTPTFKNKRPQLTTHYKDILDDLYASLK